MSELIHYGVLGMHWGVRKDGKPQGFQYGGKGKKHSSNEEFPKKKNNGSRLDDVKAVNPHRGNLKYQNNCMLCVAAYDLRRRGYDVTAGSAYHPAHRSAPEEWYKDLKFTNIEPVIKIKDKNNVDTRYEMYKKDPKAWGDARKKQQQNVINTLKKQKEARGYIGVPWEVGGGHAIAYEVHNGEVIFLDPQRGDVLKPDQLFSRVSPANSIEYTRLDNLEPNYTLMADYGIVTGKGLTMNNKPTRAEVRAVQQYRDRVATNSYNKNNPDSRRRIHVDMGKDYRTLEESEAAYEGLIAALDRYGPNYLRLIDEAAVSNGRILVDYLVYGT